MSIDKDTLRIKFENREDKKRAEEVLDDNFCDYDQDGSQLIVATDDISYLNDEGIDYTEVEE